MGSARKVSRDDEIQGHALMCIRDIEWGSVVELFVRFGLFVTYVPVIVQSW